MGESVEVGTKTHFGQVFLPAPPPFEIQEQPHLMIKIKAKPLIWMIE